MKFSFNPGKDTEVVLTSTALEAGTELHTSADEAATRVPGSAQVARSYNVCGLKLLAYTHPRIQTAMLGMVIFLTVGMYHVMSALGGAGQQTAYLADMASITLYTVFAAFALIAPEFLNYFGIRITLFFGGLGYAAYTANKKGTYVAIFWTVYQIGTVVGSSIPVGQNWNSGTSNSSTVTDGTYIGLFIMMVLGACTALLLWPMHKLVREDGTRVALPSQLSFKDQVITCWLVLKQNPWIVLVWPYSFGYYYYNVYQNNRFNSPTFTVR